MGKRTEGKETWRDNRPKDKLSRLPKNICDLKVVGGASNREESGKGSATESSQEGGTFLSGASQIAGGRRGPRDLRERRQVKTSRSNRPPRITRKELSKENRVIEQRAGLEKANFSRKRGVASEKWGGRKKGMKRALPRTRSNNRTPKRVVGEGQVTAHQ